MDRLEQLKQFLKENPNDPFLKYCIALEYDKQGNVESAVQAFEELIKLHENYTATYYQLGKLFEKQKRKMDAEEIYNKGLKITLLQKDHHTYSELLNARNELINDFDVEFDN